jgi:sulfate adenylyltransferase
MSGGFSPLNGFMNKVDYESVINNVRLGPSFNNAVFPMTIVLDIDAEVSNTKALW